MGSRMQRLSGVTFCPPLLQTYVSSQPLSPGMCFVSFFLSLSHLLAQHTLPPKWPPLTLVLGYVISKFKYLAGFSQPGPRRQFHPAGLQRQKPSLSMDLSSLTPCHDISASITQWTHTHSCLQTLHMIASQPECLPVLKISPPVKMGRDPQPSLDEMALAPVDHTWGVLQGSAAPL